MLSKELKDKFLTITGYKWNNDNRSRGKFKTEFPYNNREWKNSPFNCNYYFDAMNNVLAIVMTNRMTNDRYYVFDNEGKEVKSIEKYIEITKSGMAYMAKLKE